MGSLSEQRPRGSGWLWSGWGAGGQWAGGDGKGKEEVRDSRAGCALGCVCGPGRGTGLCLMSEGPQKVYEKK